MITILRRVLGMGLILAGIVCLCWPAVGAWSLEIKDLAPGQTSNAAGGKSLLGESGRNQALEEATQRKTRGRMHQVEGPAWQGLFQRTEQSKKPLYLPYCTEPLAGIARKTGQTVFYFQLPGKEQVMLYATLLSTSHVLAFVHENAWGLAHPWAWLGPWLILAGLLTYTLLPRPRKRPNQYRYSLVRSQIGPDLVALLLTGFFLVLPMFIVAENSARSGVLSLDGGWIVLTLICWFIALIAGLNLVVAAWYEALYFEVTPSGVRKVNLCKAHEYPFDQMIEMIPGIWRVPGWFRSLAWLLILVNPRLALPAILSSQVTAPTVEIPCRDGSSLNIFTKHLVDWQNLEKALLESGLEYAGGAVVDK